MLIYEQGSQRFRTSPSPQPSSAFKEAVSASGARNPLGRSVGGTTAPARPRGSSLAWLPILGRDKKQPDGPTVQVARRRVGSQKRTPRTDGHPAGRVVSTWWHRLGRSLPALRARRIPIEPELVPLLKAMHREAKGRGPVFRMPSIGRQSHKLRVYLQRAGVTRADLFTSDATRKALTFHDLRATGITWCAVRGDDPWKIMQRAGHADLETTRIYVREAETSRTASAPSSRPCRPTSSASRRGREGFRLRFRFRFRLSASPRSWPQPKTRGSRWS
jgi:hypothetical protein